MSNIGTFQPLFELSGAILECKQELEGKPPRKRQTELKKLARELEESLAESSKALIGKTVESWKSDQPLAEFLASEMELIKASSDASWHLAIDDVKERLVKLANNEEKKSTTRRKIEKNAWWILLVAIASTMVILKWYWIVDVSEKSDTAIGYYQRAEALQKLIDYDDYMGTKVRKGGMFKGVLFWPIEPTEEEIQYASDFLWTSVNVYDYMISEGLLCAVDMNHNGDDEDYDDEIAIAQVVITQFNNGLDVRQTENAAFTAAKAYSTAFLCQM